MSEDLDHALTHDHALTPTTTDRPRLTHDHA